MEEHPKENLDQEITALEAKLSALEENVDDPDKAEKLKDLHFQLGKKFAESDAFDRAIEHYENVISHLNTVADRHDEKGEIYFYLAQSYSKSEQKELAFNTFLQAREFDNSQLNGQIHQEVADFYFEEEDWDAAIENYQQAIAIHSANAADKALGRSYHLLAASYANQQQNKEALQSFEDAIVWVSKSGNIVEMGKIFYNLRIFLDNAMSFNNAYRFYQNMLENTESSDPLRAFLNHNLGLWFERDGQKPEAHQSFEKALALKEKHGIKYELGSTYYHLGAHLDANNELDKAFEYHVLALEHMLSEKRYDELGILVYYLNSTLDDMPESELKARAIEKIAEAEKTGLITETEADPSGEDEDDFLTDHKLADNLSKVAEQEQLPQASDEAFENLKNNLPENAGEFAAVAWERLESLHHSYKNAWFSKKKKKKIFEENRDEILILMKEARRKAALDEEEQKAFGAYMDQIESLN